MPYLNEKTRHRADALSYRHNTVRKQKINLHHDGEVRFIGKGWKGLSPVDAERIQNFYNARGVTPSPGYVSRPGALVGKVVKGRFHVL